MKKRNKWLLGIGLLIAFPFIVAGVNQVVSLCYDLSYKKLGKYITSKNYTLQHIVLPGRPSTSEANSDMIDSLYVHPLKLDSNGNVDTLNSDPPVYVKYSGQVYLDTIAYNFKIQSIEDSTTAEGNVQDGRSRMITFDTYGNILSMVEYPLFGNPELIKSCILLKDIILPFQPWQDHKQPIYLNHFSRDDFNSYCLNPLRGWGSSNGAGNCYYWSGEGYYNIRIGGETLKFKAPLQMNALVFPEDHEIEPYTLNFSVVPERFHKKLNAAFLVSHNQLYMTAKKK